MKHSSSGKREPQFWQAFHSPWCFRLQAICTCVKQHRYVWVQIGVMRGIGVKGGVLVCNMGAEASKLDLSLSEIIPWSNTRGALLAATAD